MTKLAPNSFSCMHAGNLMERVEEAKAALKLYNHSLETQRELIDTVAAKDVSRDDVKRFFLECYTRDFGGIADQPTSKSEIAARHKAVEAMRSMMDRFERELGVSGANAWTMANAYTGYIQHDRKSRLRDQVKAGETKIEHNLFGINAERSINAMAAALAV